MNDRLKLLVCKLLLIAAVALLITIYPVRSPAQENESGAMTPYLVEIADQPNCPLKVESMKVDASPHILPIGLTGQYQRATFDLRNVAEKRIVGYVIVILGENVRITTTSPVVTKSFKASGIRPRTLWIKDSKSTEPQTLTLSVDYVRFADGTSWGEDSAKTSVVIEAAIDGVRAVLKDLMEPPGANERAARIKQKLSVTDILTLKPEIPETFKKAHGSMRMFEVSYRGTFSSLQTFTFLASGPFLKRFDELAALIESTQTLAAQTRTNDHELP